MTPDAVAAHFNKKMKKFKTESLHRGINIKEIQNKK